MTASDLQTLLNYGGNFRDSLLAMGKDAGLPMDGEFSPDNRKAPYVEFHFVLGEPTGHRRVVAGQNPRAHLHDAFNADLIFSAVTNRETASVEHETLCAGVRLLMATIFAQPDTALRYYQLNRVTPGRNSIHTDPNKRLDLTRIPFQIHFSIRDDAWPAGY